MFDSRISQDNYGIYRTGDTFQFFENHVLNGRYDVGVWQDKIPNKGTVMSNIVWVPRQIDMETGEIY
ncbi:MAG: hypothetical protein WKF59_02515 [Chitinophagaceae bacterium]